MTLTIKCIFETLSKNDIQRDNTQHSSTSAIILNVGMLSVVAPLQEPTNRLVHRDVLHLSRLQPYYHNNMTNLVSTLIVPNQFPKVLA
jgi:hypothetical protein